MIYLIVAVALNFHSGISRHRHELSLAGFLVHRQHHQGIAAARIVTAPVYAHNHNMKYIVIGLNACLGNCGLNRSILTVKKIVGQSRHQKGADHSRQYIYTGIIPTPFAFNAHLNSPLFKII